jgi:penicillin amidase
VTVPAQALVYGDVAGNIGFWMAGRVPIRGKQNPLLPAPGWTSETDWQGYVPFDKLPHLWNPPQGYIVCANQKIAGNEYPYFLSNYWEPPSRMLRIRELLASSEKFSPEDFERFQQDVLSPYNRSIAKHIFAAYPADSTMENNDVKTAIEYLRNWDFRDRSTDAASAIFNEFIVKLMHNIYEDEMGPETFKDFVFFSAIPYRVTSQLLAADSSAWFDDVGTPQVETKKEIIHKSLLEAISELQQTSGGEMREWQWGRIHQAYFEHPFGKRKPLDRVFNIGPFPAAGSATTVNKGDYRIGEPFMVFSAPSMRQVIDLGKPQIAWTILPLGQSGQAFHKHYKDQTPLWFNGAYHAVTIDLQQIKSKPWERLILKPIAK